VKLAASIDSVLFLSAEDKTLISTYVEKHSKERMSFHTALDEKNCIQSSWKDISTGCAAIDSILGGGLKWKTITEVCGRGATGKTQLCMLMCATVQRNNTLYSQQKAMYFCLFEMNPSFIDTEHTFNASRQKELTDSLHNPYCTLSNIYVFQPQSLPEFLTLIRELPSFLHSHSDVHLLVIDSVTYFFREFTDMLRRHELLTAFVAALTRATLSFPLAVSFGHLCDVDSGNEPRDELRARLARSRSQPAVGRPAHAGTPLVARDHHAAAPGAHAAGDTSVEREEESVSGARIAIGGEWVKRRGFMGSRTGRISV
jgi:recA bacterial DNA recombination protein